MFSQDVKRVLNDLILLDHDAIDAYDQAIQRLNDGEAKNALTQFRGDHVRHVEELSRILKMGGIEPPGEGDWMSILTQGKVVLGSLMGDEMILQAMLSNEQTTNQKYEEALRTRGLAEDARRIVVANLQDERRHRSWLEARLRVRERRAA